MRADLPTDSLEMSDSEFLEQMKKFKLEKEQRSQLDDEEQRLRRRQTYKLVIFSYLALFILVVIIYLLYSTLGTEQMMGIFKLNEDVLFALNMSFNVFIYSVPAFLAACTGSFTKILLAPNDITASKHINLILGSGLIGVLTFLGLKSGIVLDLLIESVHAGSITLIDDKKSFYKMIVLCLITGMFSTTIFLTVEERVTSLANKIKNS